MYSYNKTRTTNTASRTTLSPKDTLLFGPQFGVHASASSVTERTQRQQKEPGSVKGVESLSAGNLIRRSASSGGGGSNPNDAAFYNTNMHDSSNAAMASPYASHLGRTTNTTLKRQMLPSTAFAHDLANPCEPTSMSTEELEHPVTAAHNGGRHSAQSASNRTPNTAVYLPENRYKYSRHERAPGDRVIFAESTSAPGIPIVYRTPEERSANPDRLNLDRRRLTVCPILEGEEQLRLLNYQHNMIGRIEHLSTMRRLIFLDLYDNQIEEISGLNALKSLRVLMLGKNRIRRIQNLDNLTKLDVLDLHGNQISVIEHLRHLHELRVLNLAGNMISHVDHLAGLDSLTELNLRRNSIQTVSDVDHLPSIQRLFLSFNNISSYEDIACLGESSTLSEVSLDGNPLAQDPHYKQTVLRYMTQLRQLDMKKITDDERRIASVMARKEDDKKRESTKISIIKERRRLAINNAKRQWEVNQGSLMAKTNRLVRGAMPDIYASHVGNVANSEVGVEEELESCRASGLSRPTSAKSSLSERDWPGTTRSSQRPPSASTANSSVPDVSSDVSDKPIIGGSNAQYLSEIEGDTLNLYGSGALEGLDRNWGMQAAGTVTAICFKFVDFDEVVKVLHKIRVRFPNVHTLTFNATNICYLHQLNALSQVRRLDHLCVDTEGNPVTQFTLWRTYALFRLAHFSLKKINNIDVSAADIVNAEKFFGTLAHITTSQLPQSRLLALIGEKKKQSLADDKNKKSLGDGIKLTDRSVESVGRAGLVYSPPDVAAAKSQEQNARQSFVNSYLTSMTRDAINVDQKMSTLQQTWPTILNDLIRSAVVDMWDMSAYMKKCLEELDSAS